MVVNAYGAFNGQQLNYLIEGDIHPNQTGHIALASLANQFLLPFLGTSTIELIASTEEQTTDPVSISVTATGQVIEMKWLPGEKEASDFQEVGLIESLR
ncbi:hypothetical protein BTR23_18085 [Alkalihalophilus pseudofirmus]|nr:hypothetical protein BTR23_18085 [Alkalihalophilus pseudofirmus]